MMKFLSEGAGSVGPVDKRDGEAGLQRGQNGDELEARRDGAGGAASPDGDAGGGQSGPQEEGYLTVAARDKSIKQGTIVLAAVFAAGLLSVFVMVKKSGPSAATAQAVTEDAQIEAAIAKLTGVKSQFLDRMDEIAKKFYELSNVRQVQVYELKKNPFMHEQYFGPLGEEADIEGDGLDLLNKTAVLQSKLSRKLEKMQLLSIIETSTGRCCMIDDSVVYEGDIVNGFSVGAINQDCVELHCEGMKFVLCIPQE